MKSLTIFLYNHKKKISRAINKIVICLFALNIFAGTAKSDVNFIQQNNKNPEYSEENQLTAQLDINTFTIPEHLGEIKYSHKTLSSNFIIHIQDAHCNIFAQNKIADIIQYLNTEYGIKAVNLEGGVGEYDLRVFWGIKGKALRQEVADYFVTKGEINGAEYYAINNPGKVNLWGVEDKDMYITNLQIYRNSLKYKENVDRYLKQLEDIFGYLKTHIYSSGLFKIDRAYLEYKSGSMEFKKYLEFILTIAKSYSVNLTLFQNLDKLVKILNYESTINFKKTEDERSDLYNGLKRALSTVEVRELLTKTIAFKSKIISKKKFYEYLLDKAEKLNMDSSKIQMLKAYTAYVALYEEVDKSKIMEELNKFEDALKKEIYRNEQEKKLNQLSRNLVLLNNIFSISLIKTDYKYYLENENSFDTENFINFSKKETTKYNIPFQPYIDIDKLDFYRKDIARFYELSFKRDHAFLQNIKYSDIPSNENTEQKKAAILITGGFHTENLSDLMDKQGINYISILPRFTTSAEFKNPYFEILSGETISIQETLKQSIAAMYSALAVWGKFTELAKFAAGESEKIIAEIMVVITELSKERKNEFFYILDNAGNYLKSPNGDIIEFGEGVKRGKDLKLIEIINTINERYKNVTAETARKLDLDTENEKALKTAPSSSKAADTEEKESKSDKISLDKKNIPESALFLYANALDSARDISDLMRRNIPTYIIEPSIQEADIASVSSFLKSVSKKFNKQGYNINVSSYNLKTSPILSDTILKSLYDSSKKTNILYDFADDVLKDTKTRMIIRIALTAKDIKNRNDIKQTILDGIRNALRLNTSFKDNAEEIISKIKIVEMDLGETIAPNTITDTLLDLMMADIDRYGKKDGYPKETVEKDNPALAVKFKTLLLAGITNFEFEFMQGGVNDTASQILDKIFNGITVLKIKKIDWQSLQQWKSANEAISRAV
ncbi:conserved hypothetical protein, secreted [Candidatus Omnitrophus magneticus]|uniref:Uncharacterized protein n=1 Tax=Candidatus Omnitrophus magneticus TaxID=1609969 RepID=A0A0F0CLP9_9BACT|nr:conserved hypothetical protein, secreted [Candidatus Omnitrophus magneticus]